MCGRQIQHGRQDADEDVKRIDVLPSRGLRSHHRHGSTDGGDNEHTALEAVEKSVANGQEAVERVVTALVRVHFFVLRQNRSRLCVVNWDSIAKQAGSHPSAVRGTTR